MAIVSFGAILIVASMGVIMGSPFIYFIKRDMRWEAGDKSAIDAWYN